jgi:hypothetical protein
MPLGIQIRADTRAAELTLALAVGAVRPASINRWAAGAVANTLRGHFRALAAERHGTAFPGVKPPHNFYADAARATTWEADENRASVSVAHRGIRLRFEGGTVRPVNAKFLAIPARAEAYGRRPREFDDLKPIFFKHSGALVQTEQQQVRVRKRKSGAYSFKIEPGGELGGGVMFWLVKSATHAADPTVLPTDEALHAAALDEVRRNIGFAIVRGLARNSE